MAYTPELSIQSSSTLRRIAWGINLPMTKTIELIFEYLPKILDKEKICSGCRDKTKCQDCEFNSPQNQIQHKREMIA